MLRGDRRVIVPELGWPAAMGGSGPLIALTKLKMEEEQSFDSMHATGK